MRVGGEVILSAQEPDQVAQIKGVHECDEKNSTHEHEPLGAELVLPDKHHTQKQSAEGNWSNFRIGTMKEDDQENDRRQRSDIGVCTECSYPGQEIVTTQPDLHQSRA